MSRIRIGDHTWTFDAASLELYHCMSSEADWNLALVRAGATLWLAGTVVPGPRSPEALLGAEVSVDLRSLDEVAGALLGRHVTLYPGGQDVCALRFRLAASPGGVRLAASAGCDWDRYLKTFDHDRPVDLELDIDAAVVALHPGNLP
ncbi:hypothetical protein SAMN02745121_06056 [Nannocystis exedens]|uniref:Uncharacterized protein n=1 Tax=Nannocystis exedens TaxID=54 RepID=A0A1I2EEJ6_9BACT|nr:hypothetical protein [Nannocystis exedens]PCC74764.1 hypothetical protein NAEX_07863 [Nannocystis exedens]SFE91275.1 hypothetical protein SAMN02745121_06056 [Nannocystis exedens]